MFFLRHSGIAVPCLFISCTQLALADSEAHQHKAKDIEHVLVTIPRHRSEAETALPVTLLTDEILRDKAVNSLGETLSKLPGLSSSSFGPSVGQPVVRGQQGARVSVLQNSTGSADASNSSADHAVSVEPVLAESIEILRGPSTLLYGGGAIGGVINVIDRRVPVKLHDTVDGRFELRHGTVNHERTAILSLDGSIEHVGLHADFLNRETNDISIPSFAINTEAEENSNGFIPNTESETRSFTFGTSYISDRGYIGFSISQLDDLYGIPPGAHEHEDEHDEEEHHDEEEGEHHDEEGHDEHEEEEEIIRIDLSRTRYDVRADLHDPFSGVEKIRWFFTYTDYAHDELEGDEVGTRWQNDSAENRIEILHDDIMGWHGVVGLQSSVSDYSAVGDESYIPKVNLLNHGLFIVEDFHSGDWSYELGARFDYNELDIEESAAESSFSSVSLSASALWQINDPWRMGVAFSHAERAPVVEELYSNDGNIRGDYVEHVASGFIEVGDAFLEQEQSNNIDLTFSYENEIAKAKVTAFYNLFNDYIFLSNTGDTQGETEILQYTQEDAEFSGLEFEAAFSLNEQWSLLLLSDFVYAELDKSGYVPRLPPYKLGVELGYSRDNFSFALDSYHFGKQDKTSTGESITPSYNQSNLNVRYNMSEQINCECSAFVRIKNITDEEIRRSTSFLKNISPEPGRSIEVGIRARF